MKKTAGLGGWRSSRILEDIAVLRGAAIIRGLGENATTIQSVIYDFTYCRSIRVDIHPVTGAQVTHDTLGCDVKSRTAQFRETACLYVVNSK